MIRAAALFLALHAPAALAQEDLAAEHLRLQGEVTSLAKRSAWQGVDRGYRTMVAHQMPLDDVDHLLGAQAAQAQGDPLLAIQRLRRVSEAPTDDAELASVRAQAREFHDGLMARYRLVAITVINGRQPVLTRAVAPFATDEQAAIAQAGERLAADGVFRGVLPLGEYAVDGEPVVIEAGEDWLAVIVR